MMTMPSTFIIIIITMDMAMGTVEAMEMEMAKAAVMGEEIRMKSSFIYDEKLSTLYNLQL